MAENNESEMTPEQATDFIRKHRHLLNLAGIAKEAGIPLPHLSRYINEKKRADGYAQTLSAEKLQRLANCLQHLCDKQ